MQIKAPQQSTQTAEPGIRVWDWPVRVIHWSLVLAVLGAWLTRQLEGDWFAWHVRCGYVVLVLVTARIIWGFVGTRYARFGDFLRGPTAIVDHVRGLFAGHSAERGAGDAYPGHNPLGALMIVLLLAALWVQAVSGLFANDKIFQTGPLFGYVSSAVSDQLTTLHKRLFDVLWIAIALHVTAAVLYTWILRQPLITAMFTGRKRGTQYAAEQGIRSSRSGLAILILLCVIGLLTVIVMTAPEAFLFDF